jgi:ketosteroid isomerase-like protein
MSTVTTSDSRITRLLAALRSNDSSQIKAICHPDMVVIDPESLPYGGTYRGLQGMVEVTTGLFEYVKDWKCETEKIIGDPAGDDFVLVQRMTGKTKSGRPVDMPILEQYTFRDGLLIMIRPYYWDTKAILDLFAQG